MFDVNVGPITPPQIDDLLGQLRRLVRNFDNLPYNFPFFGKNQMQPSKANENKFKYYK